jgi:hypothetical protein
MRASAARSPLPAILAISVMPLLSHIIIFATRHIRLGLQPSLGGLFKLGFVTASALSHWAIYAALLTGFALTLRPGREPLITAMARRMHDLTPEMVSYTRKVTFAWSFFFAFQLAASVTLFCFAPLVVWSFFVNILDIPLVVSMFAAEYAVRLLCLRDPPRHSLAAIVKMVTEVSPKAHELPLATAVEPEA